MSTCKDCIHAEQCRDYLAYKLDKALDGIDGSEKPICEFFKDRSKFIELPCKVGDIFWALDPYVKSPYDYFISPYQCLGIKYGYDCIEGDNTIMLLAVGGREYIFGKEAFLTEEEAKGQAKQALRERENG